MIEPTNEQLLLWSATASHKLGVTRILTEWDYLFVKQGIAWAADAELEACIRELDFKGFSASDLDALRAARRPKPPSTKEKALALLEPGVTRLFNGEQQDLIRRALESIPEETT